MGKTILTNSVVDPSIQQPWLTKDVDFFQQWNLEVVLSLIKNLVGAGYAPLTPYVVEGLRNTGSGANVIIAAGTIHYAGVTFSCAGITTTLTGSNVIVGKITTGFDTSIDPVTFSDGSPHSVHEIKTIVLSQAATGTFDFDYNDFVFIQDLKPITKRIAIGDWNMDSTTGVNITHGLDFTKIIDVSVMIVSDNGAIIAELTTKIDNATSGSPGGGFFLSATQVVMERLAGGYFDQVGYDSTGYNRGYVNITYLL